MGKILIDGVIFFLQKGRPAGISRVWRALLEELAASRIAERLVLLDRAGTAPVISGIRGRRIHAYNPGALEADPLPLEAVCRKENADLFLSTYYTWPENTPCALMLHDMIPERLGLDLTQWEWRAKDLAIRKANAYFAVSDSTAWDFGALYPQFGAQRIDVVPNAVGREFHPQGEKAIVAFKKRYGITRPYFILTGHRLLYKNAVQFFRGFGLLENRRGFQILCTGGARTLEPIFVPYLGGAECQVRFLSDDELSIAYAGAMALVYPSLYEGFGLPVLEAMASGCPVITCRNSSLPEVAGDAALYVREGDVADMLRALHAVQETPIRRNLVARGLENAGRFSWTASARALQDAIFSILEDLGNGPGNPSDPINTEARLLYRMREERGDTELVRAMAGHLRVFSGQAAFQLTRVSRQESVLSGMDDEAFAVMTQGYRDGGRLHALFGYWYGLALLGRGRYQDAWRAFHDAYRLNVGHRWRSAFLAAVSAFEGGDQERARDLLESKVLTAVPDFDQARKLLEKVR